MSTLSDLSKYTFKTEQETDLSGKVTREPVTLNLRAMSLRERDDTLGSLLLCAFRTSQEYHLQPSSDNFITVHGEAMKLVVVLGDKLAIEEVVAWRGRQYGPVNTMTLIVAILRKEGMLPPEETADETTESLPSATAVDKMDEAGVEALGEN